MDRPGFLRRGLAGEPCGSPALIYEGGEEWIGRGS